MYLCIMKRKILQSLADFTINKLESANDEDVIQFYLKFGYWLNGVAVNYFDIYLD